MPRRRAEGGLVSGVEALVLRDDGAVSVETLRADAPGPGEVAVRMAG